MELWPCPTELWPGKLTAYRKLSVCLPVERLQKITERKKNQTIFPSFQADSKKGSFQNPFVNNKCGKLTIGISLADSKHVSKEHQKGGFQRMLCDKPAWGSTNCPSCARHPSAGVCTFWFSLCMGPAPQPSWEQWIHHRAGPGRHWHRGEPLLGGRTETPGFYIPENACQIPEPVTQLSTGFPHLVLQSVEIRSVKCHWAFNVACLQIVWTRLC